MSVLPGHSGNLGMPSTVRDALTTIIPGLMLYVKNVIVFLKFPVIDEAWVITQNGDFDLPKSSNSHL